MARFDRVLLFLLDSVGVGELPDAAACGDAGAATVQHTLEYDPNLTLPNLERMGLFSLPGLERFSAGIRPVGRYGRCREVSAGKDSIVGHWEVMGYPTSRPFNTFPGGFPEDLINAFAGAIGREVLCNERASGTELLERRGADHLRTGLPMVYTSVDSVFQIAAHEEIVPPSSCTTGAGRPSGYPRNWATASAGSSPVPSRGSRDISSAPPTGMILPRPRRDQRIWTG